MIIKCNKADQGSNSNVYVAKILNTDGGGVNFLYIKVYKNGQNISSIWRKNVNEIIKTIF